MPNKLTTIKMLVNLANHLDKKGLHKEADLLDQGIQKLAADPATDRTLDLNQNKVPDSEERPYPARGYGGGAALIVPPVLAGKAPAAQPERISVPGIYPNGRPVTVTERRDVAVALRGTDSEKNALYERLSATPSAELKESWEAGEASREERAKTPLYDWSMVEHPMDLGENAPKTTTRPGTMEDMQEDMAAAQKEQQGVPGFGGSGQSLESRLGITAPGYTAKWNGAGGYSYSYAWSQKDTAGSPASRGEIAFKDDGSRGGQVRSGYVKPSSPAYLPVLREALKVVSNPGDKFILEYLMNLYGNAVESGKPSPDRMMTPQEMMQAGMPTDLSTSAPRSPAEQAAMLSGVHTTPGLAARLPTEVSTPERNLESFDYSANVDFNNPAQASAYYNFIGRQSDMGAQLHPNDAQKLQQWRSRTQGVVSQPFEGIQGMPPSGIERRRRTPFGR